MVDTPLSTAKLVSSGTSKDVLAGRRYRALHRGVHVPADVPDSPDLRILAAIQLMRPGDVLGGWAAARVLGFPHLDGSGVDGRQDVLVYVPVGARRARRDGVRQVRAEVQDVVDVDGIPVTGPVVTAVDLLRWATDWREGVVAVECLLATGRVTTADVRRFVDHHPGLRGLSQVRRALPHLSEHSWSPGETRLRLVWELEAGLARPLANVEVFSDRGHLIGVTDLLDPESGTVGEYDGRAAHERRVRQDRLREESLEAANLQVLRFFHRDVTIRRGRTAHRLRQAHARGLARDRSRDGWFARLSDGRILRPGERLERSASPPDGRDAKRSSRSANYTRTADINPATAAAGTGREKW